MSNDFSWLPDLIFYTNDNMDNYIEILYTYFKQDFLDRRLPTFAGKPMNLKRHPLIRKKEATFWHIITEGKIENERVPDLRRCERIRWIRPTIEQAQKKNPVIKIWKNIRSNKIRRAETRICLWLEEKEYLVVLAERSGYILPWTAYEVTREHSKKKLTKEYEEYKKQILLKG